MTDFSVLLVARTRVCALPATTLLKVHIKFVFSTSTVRMFSAGPAFFLHLLNICTCMHCIVQHTIPTSKSVHKCVSATPKYCMVSMVHGFSAGLTFFDRAQLCADPSKPSIHTANTSIGMCPGIQTMHSEEHPSIHIVSRYRVRTGVFRTAFSPGVGSSKTPSLPPPFVTKHNGLPQ